MGFREAFCQLESIDPDFQSINFVREDWDKATALYDSWRVLKDASRSLSDRKYNTANGCFPMMYHIFFKFLHWEKSGDYYFSDIASSLRKDFDEYWRISNLILVITVVLDPRFKMDIVERWYKEIYGNVVDTHLKLVTDAIANIYNEYAERASNSESSSSWGCGEMLDDMWRPCMSSQHVNDVVSTELDRYLGDSKFCPVQEFDILAWWRLNSSTFPTLARMACDFLAIPISAPIEVLDSPLVTEIEDIFDCQILDDDFKVALACTKVWL
ncbi:zinc finger BED domain-containing protein RICESLEEPER 1-like isoform X1 [Pistacia vera]|uniref:zinc finger BED domain-containing protein RICESLEEPER 1-like isoform X1 n=1 Tax=Pistacia vera TaxID=55513 RepID=UPI001263833D|nr:zinc finger BED domain-containing protein RICESLEEPER 1-like isoform X1 [Pistacia vera]XP_031249079.1 zinc finger BED domain-containing protein RICESLEEPER 1-like isoform X1 [Pistacia vera]